MTIKKEERLKSIR